MFLALNEIKHSKLSYALVIGVTFFNCLFSFFLIRSCLWLSSAISTSR